MIERPIELCGGCRPPYFNAARLSRFVTGDLHFLPFLSVQLPYAEPEHCCHSGEHNEGRDDGNSPGHLRPASPAFCRYSDHISAAFDRRSPPITPSVVKGTHSSTWTHHGGSAASCRVKASATTMAPTIMV